MAAPLLETRQSQHAFRWRPGGTRASTHAGEGELRCLIGPNGAGKSTFFQDADRAAASRARARCCFAVTIFPAPTPTRSRVSALASRPRCRVCLMV